jgi:hypothetical protein
MQQHRDDQPAAGAVGRDGCRAGGNVRRDLMTVHVPVPSVDDAPRQLSSGAVSEAEIAPLHPVVVSLNPSADVSQACARHVSDAAESFTACATSAA